MRHLLTPLHGSAHATMHQIELSVCLRKEAVVRVSFATFSSFVMHNIAVFMAALCFRKDHECIEPAVCAVHSGELFLPYYGLLLLVSDAYTCSTTAL